MSAIVEIRNLSKFYRLGGPSPKLGSFREAILDTLSKPLRFFRNGHQKSGHAVVPFWALRDVSFDVHQGETVGIVGSNGAGKSTLLKIISRITDPTEGDAWVRGRVASLLEVGTGFHPELTGRENVYLNGAILGMRKSEIDTRFDEIAAFAGIDEFLDTPVKRYSSGMYVRLAFSVAAHLDPEILIVDEVLAVGDVAFQKKCLGRMAEVSRSNRTVLFVSHNLAAVESLCNRVVVLQGGRVAFIGPAKEGIQFYLQHSSSEAGSCDSGVVDLSNAKGRSPKYAPQLKRLELYSDGTPVHGAISVGAPLQAVITFDLQKPCTGFDIELAFDSPTGQRVCTAHSAYEPKRVHEPRVGEQVFICDIPNVPLIPGEYKIQVGLDIMNNPADRVEDAVRLSVVKADYYGTGVVPTRGMFLVENRWKTL